MSEPYNYEQVAVGPDYIEVDNLETMDSLIAWVAGVQVCLAVVLHESDYPINAYLSPGAARNVAAKMLLYADMAEGFVPPPQRADGAVL